MAVNIILADDHTLFREGLLSILNAELEFNVIEQADNGREVIKLVRKNQVDVIIMDIAMPDLNGIEATRQLMHEFPELKDKRRMARILDAGMVGTTQPTDIPEPVIPEINHFAPSQPWVAPKEEPKKAVGKTKSKKDE